MCQTNTPYNKAYLPLGSGDRVRRLKQKAVAQFKNTQPTAPDGGINSFPSSTRLIQEQGLLNVTVYSRNTIDANATGLGCCPNTN